MAPEQEKLESIIGPEFQSLPLQVILSSAMNGITSAQQISAKTTADYIAKTKRQVTFDAKIADGAMTKEVTITVPELAIVPIPSLQVDSATIHFTFEIKEVITTVDSTGVEANVNVTAKGLLKALIDASVSGSVTHKDSAENTLNRSGMLDISIHLSQPSIPEGLNKVLSFLGNSITIVEKK